MTIICNLICYPVVVGFEDVTRAFLAIGADLMTRPVCPGESSRAALSHVSMEMCVRKSVNDTHKTTKIVWFGVQLKSIDPMATSPPFVHNGDHYFQQT